MKNVLIHGLGQNSKDWDTVKNELNMDTVTPELFELIKDKNLNYTALYQAFSELCNSYQDCLNLCGLSLGGLLALNYAIQYPSRINSLVLIGIPYEIPKRLLKFQSLVFHLMPQSAFKNMGCGKKNLIDLSNSMADLNFMKSAVKLDCPVIIICGEKDRTNMESAKRFHEIIGSSDFVIVQDSGHEVNRDNPHELAGILKEFWKEN